MGVPCSEKQVETQRRICQIGSTCLTNAQSLLLLVSRLSVLQDTTQTDLTVLLDALPLKSFHVALHQLGLDDRARSTQKSEKTLAPSHRFPEATTPPVVDMTGILTKHGRGCIRSEIRLLEEARLQRLLHVPSLVKSIRHHPFEVAAVPPSSSRCKLALGYP